MSQIDKDEDELYSIVEPDMSQLDKEWQIQPRLVLRYSRKVVKAEESVAVCKSELEIVAAEIAQDVRSNPEKYKVSGQVTDSKVEMRVKLHKNYQDAATALLKAKTRLSYCEAMVTALEHKKRALENLVQLYLNSYFSTPRVKGKEVQEQTESIEKTQTRKPLKSKGT